MNLKHLREIASRKDLLEYDEYFIDSLRKTIESLIETVSILQDRVHLLEIYPQLTSSIDNFEN